MSRRYGAKTGDGTGAAGSGHRVPGGSAPTCGSRSDCVFRRQANPAPRPAPHAAPGGATGTGPDERPGELGRLAARFGLHPWDAGDRPAAGPPSSVPPLAVAIQRAAPLWSPPRGGGEVPLGVSALCGGHPPASLIGVPAWPVLIGSGSGPALVLADLSCRVHVVVDVAHSPSGHPVRPRWIPAGVIAHGARMPGSHPLWRHWAPELCAHAPHAAAPTCESHTHLARPNAQGQLVTGVPQHDAWVMSRSWLPPEYVVPSAADAKWVVLGASDRPPRERDQLIRSRWDAVSFEQFAAVVAARHADDVTLPPALAVVLRMMLAAGPAV